MPNADLLFAGADTTSLPPSGLTGAYALFFWLPATINLSIGRLGQRTLPAGWLIYVGSALGPGGLQARLRRHLAASKRSHWHIDALSIQMRPVWWLALGDGRRRECDWAQRLRAHPAATIPVPGFGSSDCRRGCEAHLIAFPAEMPLAALSQWLLSQP